MDREVMPLGGVPFIASWGEFLADAHWRHLVRVRKIVPRKARTYHRPLVVIGNPSKDGRCNPLISRRIHVAAKLFRGKQNQQLMFDLAMWHGNRRNKMIPKRGLAKHVDDSLWGILQRHGEVPLECWGLDNLNQSQRKKLETRLHQHWPIVEQAALALYASMKRATNARRKPKKPFMQALLQLTNSAKT